MYAFTYSIVIQRHVENGVKISHTPLLRRKVICLLNPLKVLHSGLKNGITIELMEELGVKVDVKIMTEQEQQKQEEQKQE